MSFLQGKNILKIFTGLLRKPSNNWSNFEIESSFQLNEFVDILLEPIKSYQSCYLIKLGLHEALVNAVKHGNKSDPRKNIRVRRIITPNWCVWQIQDQGSGFELKKRNYDLPKRISSVNGRGLYIINECFDDIRWSNKGNRLQLALKR